jgi:serine/threonine-protein kinase
VKPSNLFLGSDQQVKILDFGIAKLSTSVLTRTGKILGTPNYMAPEQIAGENCGPLSDLFSAAIVTFEFLAGVHPFQAPFIPKRIMSGEPDGLCEVDPAFPLELQTVLGRALAREPEERYPTGEDLAAALRGVLADETWDWTETTEIAKAERVDSDGPTATVVAPLDMLDRGNSPESK